MNIKKGKLLALVFVFSEAFFFIALIIAYVYYRNFSNKTSTVAQYLDALRSGIFTLFLVASSFTLIASKRALSKQKITRYKWLLGITIILGIIFITGQITEYIGLYHDDITMNKDIFGSTFFTLTGFHGVHVILGLISLAILFIMSLGKFKNVAYEGFEGVDVYWHFVDIVWIFVFYFVYITPLL